MFARIATEERAELSDVEGDDRGEVGREAASLTLSFVESMMALEKRVFVRE